MSNNLGIGIVAGLAVGVAGLWAYQNFVAKPAGSSVRMAMPMPMPVRRSMGLKSVGGGSVVRID